MIAVWCLPRLHRLMHRLKHPVLILGAGGLMLGVLGAIGGTVTLFKGLDEMQQLAFSQVFSVSDYLLFALVKLAALVVAAACGFRGGRIFRRCLSAWRLGLMLHEHVDAVPAAITVSCSILGLVLVVTRDAWLSLFMAAVVVPDSTLFPLLCIVMLPAWLLLAGQTDDDGLAKRQVIRRYYALPELGKRPEQRRDIRFREHHLNQREPLVVRHFFKYVRQLFRFTDPPALRLRIELNACGMCVQFHKAMSLYRCSAPWIALSTV